MNLWQNLKRRLLGSNSGENLLESSDGQKQALKEIGKARKDLAKAKVSLEGSRDVFDHWEKKFAQDLKDLDSLGVRNREAIASIEAFRKELQKDLQQSKQREQQSKQREQQYNILMERYQKWEKQFNSLKESDPSYKEKSSSLAKERKDIEDEVNRLENLRGDTTSS